MVDHYTIFVFLYNWNLSSCLFMVVNGGFWEKPSLFRLGSFPLPLLVMSHGLGMNPNFTISMGPNVPGTTGNLNSSNSMVPKDLAFLLLLRSKKMVSTLGTTNPKRI